MTIFSKSIKKYYFCSHKNAIAMPSVYIHIPFCQTRCIYCDFYSTTSLSQQTRYVDCLLREMDRREAEWQRLTAEGQGRASDESLRARSLLSIYIGGGTPSTLPPALLTRLLHETSCRFAPDAGTEITLEANPDDVSPAWIEAVCSTPVNRVSMGVQTFDDAELLTLRRRHTSLQAKEAVRMLREAGITNLSIDLIYGLPGQSLAAWERNVDEAIALHPPHISAYSLMYEEGTPLTGMRDAGILHEMDDETSWLCYETLCSKLHKAGYEHYEISNFCLPQRHSRHNSGYWDGTAYMGFGAGAHSYDGHRLRRSNLPSLRHYMDSIERQKDDYFETEQLSDRDLYNEFVMTRLRTSQGFLLDELTTRFGLPSLQHCQQMMKPHLHQGNLIQTGNQIHLSEKGIFVSNEVISDLFL